jgi:hypothetical protein
MDRFNRSSEPQPQPWAIVRFRYHVQGDEEENPGEVVITLARYDGTFGQFVDTGIPFAYEDPMERFDATGLENGQTIYGAAMWWPDAGHWEPFPRCGALG